MTPERHEHDFLLELITEIRDRITKEGFVIFYGAGTTGNAAEVFWNEDIGGGWENFVACAKRLGATHIYFHWRAFEDSDLDELQAPVDKVGLGSDNALQMLKGKIGLIGRLTIAFVTAGVMHMYEKDADWFQIYLDQISEERVSVSKAGNMSPELIAKWADTLARNPQYGSCKSDDQREYLLEKVAGEEYAMLRIGDILRRAETIYHFEIRPMDEDKLRAEAIALRQQGLNIIAIGQKLGVSRNRISGLLSGTSNSE